MGPSTQKMNYAKAEITVLQVFFRFIKNNE